MIKPRATSRLEVQGPRGPKADRCYNRSKLWLVICVPRDAVLSITVSIEQNAIELHPANVLDERLDLEKRCDPGRRFVTYSRIDVTTLSIPSREPRDKNFTTIQRQSLLAPRNRLLKLLE
jgi:hypothetical protein